jgi:hypothetical protein
MRTDKEVRPLIFLVFCVIPVGVSILTNGSRRRLLERCIDSLLENCYYRPLVIGIYSNGSTDDTGDWIQGIPPAYGIEWRLGISESDSGCANGTNSSMGLVADCALQMHLESDFEHLPETATGVDKMWLHRAVKLLDSGDCDYLYLRRMRNPQECAMHWWDQWMPKVTEEQGEYLKCPGFWWSNNPTLFRYSALKEANVLPLDESKDGAKGQPGWSQPELQAGTAPKPWLHRWGVFIHERSMIDKFANHGCDHDCKYGFWMPSGNKWCSRCDQERDFRDMVEHRKRVQ